MKRICILDLPSPFSEAWRQALAEKAIELGFKYLEIWGELHAPLDDDADYLIVSGDVAGGALANPTQWLVLYASPAQAIEALSSHGEHAFWLAASRLAMGAAVLQNGGTSLDSSAQTIVVPGFGTVRREDVITSTPAKIEALAFYEVLPPTPGAKAVWPGELFVIPEEERGTIRREGDPISIAGRRRVIAHAPYIELCPGEWNLRLRIKVDPQSAANIMGFEWGPGEDVVFLEHRFEKPGRYELNLTNTWRAVTPMRMLIWAQRPTFDGVIWVESAEIEYL